MTPLVRSVLSVLGAFFVVHDVFLVPAGGRWSRGVTLPNDARLVGLGATWQSWFLATGTARGFETTNGSVTTLGR